jgi:hypothetical protein
VSRKDQARGRLIAVEGTRGADLRKSARALRQRLVSRKVPVGISWWDASGAFFEMGLGKRKHRVASPRTLMLLYAADLLFRLRWEIRPALAEGRTVIAAPYLETAIAFGRACGLPRHWLASLFSFAPRPDVCRRVEEHKKAAGWKGNAQAGFAEFSSAALYAVSSSFDPVRLRRETIALLGKSGRRGRVI